MPSKEAHLVTTKIKQVLGEVPEDIRQNLLANKAAFEVFVRGVALQIDSDELITLVVIETGSPIMIHDMDKLAREVANELINPEEVSTEK